MMAIFALVSLLATALAAPVIQPAAQVVTFQLTNDIAGITATGNIAANGVAVRLGDLFGNTNLVENGRVVATSAQLVANFQNTFCIFQNGGQAVDIANEQMPFAELDGVEGVAVETDVTDFTFLCEI